MKRTSESATWVLKMCRNFFYFLIYVPFPSRKSALSRVLSRREGSRTTAPTPSPPPPPHPAARFQGPRIQHLYPGGGLGGQGVQGADLSRQAGGGPREQNPKDGAAPPPPESPMGPGCTLPKPSFPGSSASRPRILISFMRVSTFSANFP